MIAALLLSAGLIWLICATAAGERIPRPREIRVGDAVRVQARFGVFVKGTVVRHWIKGTVEYVDVAGEDGERYIRATDLVGRC